MARRVAVAAAALLLLASSVTASLTRDVREPTQGTRPATVPVTIVEADGFELLGTSNQSALYRFNQTDGAAAYEYAPYLVKLKGGRFQIGYDYAALLGEQTSFSYNTFLDHLTDNNTKVIGNIEKFIDFLWDRFYVPHVPQEFLTELSGMEAWCSEHATECGALRTAPHDVARRFYGLANMPADSPNIISGLEREFERGWPWWLKDIVNSIIKYLEKFVHSCDAYGVWGSRTESGRLYTSRNLDYNSNTGINRYKLLQIYDIDNGPDAPRMKYSGFGFSIGLGVLAGQSQAGITTSEMNLDNSETTYSGLPFPLRLRYVMENSHDLQSAMTVWNATNNTNSFNFLIGSATDGQAYALETMFNFTAVFPADSPIEAAATYPCGYPPHYAPTCHKWVFNKSNEYGNVRIGFPLPEAVWRTNHGMNPRIMATQEPLFNNTIFRYNLMHDLFSEYGEQRVPIADADAVGIVATLGIKGIDYFTCDQELLGDNVLSVAYVPGEGRAFVAWEEGSGSAWRPASCATYIHVNLSAWWTD